MSAGGERRSDDLYHDLPFGTWPGFSEPYGEAFWSAASAAQEQSYRLDRVLNCLTRETATTNVALIERHVERIRDRYEQLDAAMEQLLDCVAEIETAKEDASDVEPEAR